MQSIHTLVKLAQLRWTGHVTRMPDERLQTKILYGELQVGNDPMVVKRSDTRTPSKPPLKLQHTVGKDCTGSSKAARLLVNTKQKESARLSRNVRSKKPELKHHQQSFLPQTSLVLSATGSLELRLVSLAILEYTNHYENTPIQIY